MFTIRRTARSCPTILPRSRRSKSSTSELRISGSRSTSSETNGLTIALYLLPVFPSLVRTAADQLPPLNLQVICQSNLRPLSLTSLPPFRWNHCSSKGLPAGENSGFSGGSGLLRSSGGKVPRILKRSCLRRTHGGRVPLRPGQALDALRDS